MESRSVSIFARAPICPDMCLAPAVRRRVGFCFCLFACLCVCFPVLHVPGVFLTIPPRVVELDDRQCFTARSAMRLKKKDLSGHVPPLQGQAL